MYLLHGPLSVGGLCLSLSVLLSAVYLLLTHQDTRTPGHQGPTNSNTKPHNLKRQGSASNANIAAQCIYQDNDSVPDLLPACPLPSYRCREMEMEKEDCVKGVIWREIDTTEYGYTERKDTLCSLPPVPGQHKKSFSD